MANLKTILTTFAALLTVSACACNTNKNENNDNKPNMGMVTDNSKTLIVYFSKRGVNYKQGVIDKGNTEIIAEYIEELTGADVFRIIPEKDYEKIDNYDELVELTRIEHENNERPTFQGEISDIEQYETIFIGSPIWWYTFPQVIYTFLDRYDLNGKNIVPFTTHEGSGLADVVDVLRNYYPKAKIVEGLAIRGRDARKSKEKVTEWLNEIGINTLR